MNKKTQFESWMKDNLSISDSSIRKYSGAINTISKELIEKGSIAKSLYDIENSYEVDSARQEYFSYREFKSKNVRGNNMYSSAIGHYIEFLRSRAQ